MLISKPTGTSPAGSVHDFLVSERQWPRACRIARAQSERRLAQTDVDRAFWNQVIKTYRRVEKTK